MTNNAALDFEVDMGTIRNYVSAVVEAKDKITTTFIAALDNAQLVFQTASPAEARPDLIGVMLKSGLKSVEKVAVSSVKGATGADLGPLVDMVHAIYDEVTRAAKAAGTRSVADWMARLRTTIVNQYTQGQTGESLRIQIEQEYNQNDEGGRGGYIAGIENELVALRSVQAPLSQVVELAMYEEWINQNFDNDCIDGSGFVQLVFDSDSNPSSATVVAVLGDRVAARLNDIMSDAGVWQIMDLGVVKQVCFDSECACFEQNNVTRKEVLDGDTQAFLASPDTWQQFTRFTT
jgi:hypothetical protein